MPSHILTLFEQLKICSERRFTGRLQITGLEGKQFNLHFFMGKTAGDSDGVHPIRRWHRQLLQNCPQLVKGSQEILTTYDLQGSSSYSSTEGLLRSKSITRQQATKLIEGSLMEVLFDLLRQEELNKLQPGLLLSYSRYPNLPVVTIAPQISIEIESLLPEVKRKWEAWCEAGLKDYSPNLAPAIIHPQKLEQEVSAAAYHRLTNLMDGSRTLRDLAVKMGQDPLLLTQSLLCFVYKNTVNLVEISDLSSTIKSVTPITDALSLPSLKVSTTSKSELQDSPTVAYIDDSPVDSQIMGQILIEAGYRYLSIRDPLQALQTLLDYKPKFIFLDLVMPIASG